MPTIREGAWRLIVIPQDHDPRHVHAMLGKDGPEVVLRLGENREVTPTRVDALAALWEVYS